MDLSSVSVYAFIHSIEFGPISIPLSFFRLIPTRIVSNCDLYCRVARGGGNFFYCDFQLCTIVYTYSLSVHGNPERPRDLNPDTTQCDHGDLLTVNDYERVIFL